MPLTSCEGHWRGIDASTGRKGVTSMNKRRLIMNIAKLAVVFLPNLLASVEYFTDYQYAMRGQH